MIKLEDYTKVGFISKTHGVKGNMNCEFSFDLYNLEELEYIFLRIDNYLVPFYVENLTISSSSTMLIKLEDIDDVETASIYKSKEIFFPNSLVSELANFAEDYTLLVGFNLLDAQTGKIVGLIADIDNYSDNIVLKVVSDSNEEFLIPLNEDLIAGLDEVKKELSLNIPEGLMEIYTSNEEE
jgi:16S rRNA processing protein RimM